MNIVELMYRLPLSFCIHNSLVPHYTLKLTQINLPSNTSSISRNVFGCTIKRNYVNYASTLSLFKSHYFNPSSDCKLNINYLHVAKACIHCEAYFMAVLCLEMWALSEQSPLENEDFQLIAKEVIY